jgi:hypothetical protein
LLCHCGLDVDGAPGSVDGTGKLNQKAVAGRFNDPPPMLRYLGIDNIPSDGL